MVTTFKDREDALKCRCERCNRLRYCIKISIDHNEHRYMCAPCAIEYGLTRFWEVIKRVSTERVKGGK